MNKGTELMLAGMTVLGLAIVTCPSSSFAQLADQEYVRQALAAGPEVIAKDAAVVRPESDGSMRTIRQGTNGFTCLIMDTDRMCADRNSMEFIHAIMHHQPPADQLGLHTCWPAMLARPARLAEPATAARMQHPKTPTAIGSSRDRT
jgi:hypothetical protein